MSSANDNHQSLLKISQIYHSFNDNQSSLQNVNRVLKKEGNINYQIPADSSLGSISPNLIGGTALHIAAFKNDIAAFDTLLKNGADFTIQNQDGNTILHYIIENVRQNTEFISSIFSAHIEHKITDNLRNNKGISHFHIACLTGNFKAVEYFLDNNVSVDEAVNSDSYDLSGWTPLHIATRFSRINVLQLLLDHKVNVYIKNAVGMTPLHLLVKRKLDKRALSIANDESRDDNSRFIQLIDDMIKLLLDSCDVVEMFPNDEIGLTHFQVACTMQDSSLAESLIAQITNLDHQIKIDSPVWPGYTALHFAAYCNIEIVKMLIEKGANVNIKDAKGVTPLEICLQKSTLEKVLSIIEFNKTWKSVSFTNSRMKLFNLISAMKSPTTFAKYLSSKANGVNASLPRDFVLWPGFTPLHLAVLLSANKDHELIKVCFDLRTNFNAQDCRGRTPLILAFRLNKPETVNLLLLYQYDKANPHDDEGLSHLHIACEVNNSRLLKNNFLGKKLSLKKIENINVAYRGQTPLGRVKPGCTPLHVAIANSGVDTVEMLLNHRADCRIKDANGLTPIDWFLYVYPNLSPESRMKLRLLLTQELNRKVDKDDGLTWLHVASCFNYVKTVKKLLQRKVNVDPRISCEYPSNFWSEYVGCTPLHLATLRSTSKKFLLECSPKEIFNELIASGADILAMRSNGMTPLYDSLIGNSNGSVKTQILIKLVSSDGLLRRLEVISGITILHIASHCLSEAATAKSFKEKVDVDARVNDDCKIWSGFTALHLVLNNMGSVEKDKIDYHLSLLLDSEADVTVKNAEGDTPVHSLLRQDPFDENHFDAVKQLLERHKDFSVNPVGSRGMSHFHAACIVNNVEAVKQFIEHGVDVNKPVDLFAPKFAGASPLHLAINSEFESVFGTESLLQTVDLLVVNGANVSAEDSCGNTVFHKAVKMELSRMKLLEKLASREANMNSQNIFGETPLEMILKMDEIPIDVLKLFINRGYRLNAHHPASGENYLRFIFSTEYHQIIQLKAIKALNFSEVDERGRSVLHHIVTDTLIESIDWYVEWIKKFESSGMDVDIQDELGLTPLHVAAQSRNLCAVKALVSCSAEINIKDSNGKTALVLAAEFYSRDEAYEKVLIKLCRHSRRLEALHVDVSSRNISTIENSTKRIQFIAAVNIVDYSLCKQLEASKFCRIDIESSSFVLRDLIADSELTTSYPFVIESRRSRINDLFEAALKVVGFNKLRKYVKLQYKKALRRTPLVEPGLVGIRYLFWAKGLSGPYEVLVIIASYLSNSSLVDVSDATKHLDKIVQS